MKESLISAGQEFHQYQQYEQSPLASNHRCMYDFPFCFRKNWKRFI